MTDAKTPSQLAEDAAEAVRGLNHATLGPGRLGWEYPSDAYDVIGGLDRMAGGVNQALEQVWMLLSGLAGDGHVSSDHGTLDKDMTAARAALDEARAAADQLVTALSRAHSGLPGLTGVTMSDLYELLGGSTLENNLAEEYAGAVDLFGRFAGAVEDGNLRYAWEKAADVRRYLERFERRLQETTPADDGGEPITRFTGGDLDGQKVATAAVAFVQQYRAGKLLHPVDRIKDEAVKAEVLARGERTRAFRDELGL